MDTARGGITLPLLGIVYLFFTNINIEHAEGSLSVKRCRQDNSDAKFINGGYEGLLVVVGEEVEEDYALINDLRKLLNVMSEKMFQVTNRKVYIRQVDVLLPSFWGGPPKDVEESMQVKSTSSVFLNDRGHFRLKHRSATFEGEEVAWRLGNEEAKIDLPYVIKSTPCGYSGQYLRLTPDFVRFGSRAEEMIGKQEKLMLRQWAKFRWGVYDEIPIDGAASNFYTHTDLAVQPISCSMAIKGKIINSDNPTQKCSPENALNDEKCTFIPDLSVKKSEEAVKIENTSKQGGYASLMYRPDLEYVDQFCDNDDETDEEIPLERKHNSEAPTIHNLHCHGKSVWEIMREHPDFASNISTSLPEEFVLPPVEFNLLQNSDRRIVLVLDVSTSMEAFNRLKLMRQAASQFIETVPENSWIGIVTFAMRATVMSKLIKITSNDVRKVLKQRLPTSVVAGTSIGSGIKFALSVLKTSGPKHSRNSGGSMLVLSDGKEHNSPKINDTLQEVLKFGVKVTTIAFGAQVAEDLATISELTGGSSYFASSGEFADNSELRNAFLAAIESKEDDMVVVLSESVRIRKKSSVEHNFIIDETIGSDTRITVLYTDDVPPKIGLRNPEGDSMWEDDDIGYSNITADFFWDREFSTKTIEYFGTMEPGIWSLLLRNNRIRKSIAVDITVFSRSGDKQESLVLSPALLCKQINYTGSENIVIYAHLSLGEFAVLDAKIEATVTRPLSMKGNYDTAEVSLKDDGRGADVIAFDGIYSGYFTSFTLKGHYNAKVYASDNNGAARIDTDYILGLGRRRTGLITVSTKDLWKNSTINETEKSRKKRAVIKTGALKAFSRWSNQQKEFVVHDVVAVVCPKGYNHFQDSCYKFVRFPRLSSTDASSFCALDSGYLAEVNSNQEYMYLLDNVKMGDTWLGGIDEFISEKDIIAQTRTRRDSYDDDLQALTELFKTEYLNRDLREAIESFKPDWKGLGKNQIEGIIRNLGITSISEIEDLKENKLLAQQNLSDLTTTSSNIFRHLRQVEALPSGSGHNDLNLLTETTTSAKAEASSLTIKVPDKEDFESSGDIKPSCFWFDKRKLAASDKACSRKKAFYCERSKIDLVAPSRIMDFKIRKTKDPQIMRFTWTATGDDNTIGKATKYEIRSLRTRAARQLERRFEVGEVVKKEAIVNGSIDDPKISGKQEELLINITGISGCPVHAAVDLIFVLPRRLLDSKQSLPTERQGASAMIATLLKSMKISKYEVQISIIAADNEEGQTIIQESGNSVEVMNAYRRAANAIDIADEAVAKDNLLKRLEEEIAGGRKDTPKAVLALLSNDEMEILKTLKSVSKTTSVTIVGIAITWKSDLRDAVPEPKCDNAIFSDGWKQQWSETVALVVKQICRARRDEYQAWGIVAIDEEGLQSEPSNIVSSVIENRPEPVICPPEPTEAPLPLVAGISPATIGMAIAIPLAVILSIIGVIIIFGQVRKHRRKKMEAKKRAAMEAETTAAEERKEEAAKNARAKGVLQKMKIKSNKTSPISEPPV